MGGQIRVGGRDIRGDLPSKLCFKMLDIILSLLPPQNYTELARYSTLLESLAFTPNVDYRVLEIFQQFQAVL